MIGLCMERTRDRAGIPDRLGVGREQFVAHRAARLA